MLRGTLTMTYISQYEKDMKNAFDQLQKAIKDQVWNTSDYRVSLSLSALLILITNMYKMIAEIGDKINGENE